MPRTGGTARRDRIVEEAIRAFGLTGYARTSLDEIAEAAGIRKQTILYYFPTKEDLLEAASFKAVQEVAEALEDALVADPDGLERLDALVHGILRLARRRPEAVALIREVARLGPPLSDRAATALHPLVDAAADWLARAMDEGIVRRQNPRTAILTVYSAVMGHITESAVKRVVLSGTDKREADADLVAFLRAALAAAPAEAAARSAEAARRSS